MADFDSSLPIRTQNPGDVISKIADATTPSQQLKVNANGSIDSNVTAAALPLPSGASTSALQNTANSSLSSIDTKTASLGQALAAASVPVVLTSAQLSTLTPLSTVTVTATNLDIRDLAFATDKVDVSGSTGLVATVSATNLDIRDLSQSTDSIKIGDGQDFLEINANGSINVVISDISGSEIQDYKDAAAIAASGSDNHDYTVTALKTLTLTQVASSASGKAKMVLSVETDVASGVFTVKAAQFNSTANPNMNLVLTQPITVAAGVRVRVTMSNRDAQAQDLYSTILGNES